MAKYNLSNFNKTSYNKLNFPNIIPQSYSLNNYSFNNYNSYLFLINSFTSENLSLNNYSSKFFKTLSIKFNGVSLNKANHVNLLPNNNVWRKIDYRFNLQPFNLPDRFYIHTESSSFNNLGLSNYISNNLVINNGTIEGINNYTIINSKILVINKYEVNNIGLLDYNNVHFISENYYELKGLSLVTYDFRLFYVLKQGYSINGFSLNLFSDAQFLGRLLFKGKIFSQSIDNGKI